MKEISDYEMKSFGFDDLFGKHVKGWVNDPDGNSTGGWGLTLTARDMARFGYLYLNHGTWNNQQIIQRSWIDEPTAMNPITTVIYGGCVMRKVFSHTQHLAMEAI